MELKRERLERHYHYDMKKYCSHCKAGRFKDGVPYDGSAGFPWEFIFYNARYTGSGTKKTGGQKQ